MRLMQSEIAVIGVDEAGTSIHSLECQGPALSVFPFFGFCD
jgi:hypothetical protein